MEHIISNLVAAFEQGTISRRQLVQALATATATAISAGSFAESLPAAPEGKTFHAIGVNHISYGVKDYAKTRDFYADLLGMKVNRDDGKQAYLTFGDTSMIVRKSARPDGSPVVDHLAFTISDWDRPVVETELKRRGMTPSPGNDQFSFLAKDPDGYTFQICSKEMK